MALHEAARAGAVPQLLISMMVEGGERSRSHGLSRELLAAQAEAVGLPIEFGAASWSGYEAELLRVLEATMADGGAELGIFGDIDMEDHRQWVERVCGSLGAQACLPLWQRDRRELMDEVLNADGPLFRRPLAVELGERSLRDGVWFTDAWVTGA